jgi:hypothetical protein
MSRHHETVLRRTPLHACLLLVTLASIATAQPPPRDSARADGRRIEIDPPSQIRLVYSPRPPQITFQHRAGGTGWGDYVRVHPFQPSQLGWIATVFTAQSGGAEPLLYVLARQRDHESLNNWFQK